MQIICDGMQRSGSTWSFNIVKGLLARGRPGEEIYSGYDESIASFFLAAPRSAKHVLLKTHLLDAYGKALARTGEAKIIYTWRDLHDATASFLTMFGGDFERALMAITASLVVFRFHVRGQNALLVGYEDIMQTPADATARIAAYLGLEASGAVIAELVHEQSIEEVRKRVAALDAAGMVRHAKGEDNEAHDPETILHRGHIRHGGSGYGRGMLTAEQNERIDALGEEYGFFPGKIRANDP